MSTSSSLIPMADRTKTDQLRIFSLARRHDASRSQNIVNDVPQYMRLPPAYVPYVLRVSLEAGTPASKNGVFKTNFPLDGGRFEREHFCERK